MAYRYAQLGLAALMAAPAVQAVPMPQVVVTSVVVQTAVVTLGSSGAVQVPAQTPTPVANAPSNDDVNAQAVKPTSGPHTATASSAPAPSSTPASSAASSSGGSPTSGGSSGGKAGLVYSKDPSLGAMATQIAQASNGKITWMYDWEGYSDIGSTGNVEFVPMMHDWTSMFTSAWTSGNPAPQGKGVKHALFVNEPDLNNQDPGAMATLFKNTFAPHAQGAQLGGPATTGDSGPQWLSKFMSACSGCNIAFTTFHYYSASQDLGAMQKAVQAAYEAGGKKPVWVTEFGLTAQRDGGNFDAQTRANFIQKAAQWMDGVDYIQRYAPYQVSSSGSSDSITPGNAIAKAYAAA